MICAAVERCAGIDVGKEFLAVCVLTGPLQGEARKQTRRFGTIVAELERLRDWLKLEEVTHVVMERQARTGSRSSTFWRRRGGSLRGQPARSKSTQGTQDR